jgi:predicted enzyme related to lactoylglutathione lyase
METVFGWHTRWQGDAIAGGYTVHVGTDERYVALYRPAGKLGGNPNNANFVGALSHIAVVVDDLDATEKAVRAAGFTMGDHHDYEPGRRFYFSDADSIEYEVVQYD